MSKHSVYEQFESIKDISLLVRESLFDSAKQTVLFIHGIGVSGRYFIPLMEAMSAQYNVIALDLPGYGKSPKPTPPLTIERLAAVTQVFIETKDLKNCIIIGHSMGCQIIAAMLLSSDNKIAKAICISPTVNREERTLALQLLRLLQNAFYETPKLNAILVRDYARMGIMRYLRTAKWMVEDTIEERLRKVSKPILIIRGANDPIVPHDWLTYLGSLSTFIQLREVARAPHALHFNHASEVATLCDDFIKK